MVVVCLWGWMRSGVLGVMKIASEFRRRHFVSLENMILGRLLRAALTLRARATVTGVFVVPVCGFCSGLFDCHVGFQEDGSVGLRVRWHLGLLVSVGLHLCLSLGLPLMLCWCERLGLSLEHLRRNLVWRLLWLGRLDVGMRIWRRLHVRLRMGSNVSIR